MAGRAAALPAAAGQHPAHGAGVLPDPALLRRFGAPRHLHVRRHRQRRPHVPLQRGPLEGGQHDAQRRAQPHPRNPAPHEAAGRGARTLLPAHHGVCPDGTDHHQRYGQRLPGQRRGPADLRTAAHDPHPPAQGVGPRGLPRTRVDPPRRKNSASRASPRRARWP